MKISIAKYLPTDSFARGVAVLSGGTVAAQLILLSAVPVLTRLYSPDDFGVLAVFVSVLSILSVVTCLRYELAIPIAEDSQTALNVVALCLLITTGMSMLVGLLVWQVGDNLVNFLDVGEVLAYLWLLPVGIFLVGVYQTFNYWATREKAFGCISKTKLTQSVSSLLVQLSCFKLGPIGLVAGYITGQAFGAVLLAKSAFKSVRKQSVSIKHLKIVLCRYRRFPKLSTLDGLLNASSLHVFPIILLVIFGSPLAGFVALANRIAHMPITFMSSSVAQVTYTALVEMDIYEKRDFISQLSLLLSYAITPLTIILIFYGEEIFSFVFSNKWGVAGEYVGWIAVWVHFQFMSSPISNIFLVQEEQAKLLLFQITLFISRIFTLFACFLLEAEGIIYVSSFSLVSATLYFLLILWIYRVISVSVKKIIQTFLPIVLCMAILTPFYFKFGWYMFLIYTPLVALSFVLFISKAKSHFKRVSYVYIRR